MLHVFVADGIVTALIEKGGGPWQILEHRPFAKTFKIISNAAKICCQPLSCPRVQGYPKTKKG